MTLKLACDIAAGHGAAACLCLFSLLVPIQSSADVHREADTVKQRHTLLELRFENVVRQGLDYSCGAAALATLMSFYFNDPTSEIDVLQTLSKHLDAEERAERQHAGYSLLDLKIVAESWGYRAAGYRLTIEQLARLSAPVMVHVVPDGYQHFAVLRTILDDRVLLADPSRGNLRMSTARFLEEWKGIVFVLGKADAEPLEDYPLQYSPEFDFAPETDRIWRQLESLPYARISTPSLSVIPR